MPVAILFYDVVLAVHVTAIIVAFGVTFAYPVLGGQIRKLRPDAIPAWHQAQSTWPSSSWWSSPGRECRIEVVYGPRSDIQRR